MNESQLTAVMLSACRCCKRLDHTAIHWHPLLNLLIMAPHSHLLPTVIHTHTITIITPKCMQIRTPPLQPELFHILIN